MSKHGERQAFIRYYKQEAGEREVDMKKVALFAASKNWKLPEPISPIDRLAELFSQSAREETRTDSLTGRPYRANHVYVVTRGEEQLHLWIDIDEAPREPMLKSFVMRREQMVGDGAQLCFDMEHWSRINPDQEAIDLPMDLGPDIDWRKNAPPPD